MIGHLPPRPTGSGPDAVFMQWVYDTFVMLRMQETPDASTSRTTRGFQVIPNKGGGGGISLSTYRFKSMGTNHIVCRTWNGTTEGSSDVKIAKPPEMWFSVTSETLRGETISYSSYDLVNQTRLASKPGLVFETQLITRKYEVNDIIWACAARTFVTVGSEVLSLIDLNRGARAWMARPA